MQSSSRDQPTRVDRSLIRVGLCLILAVVGIFVFNRSESGKVPLKTDLAENHSGNASDHTSTSQSSAFGEAESGPDRTRSSNRKTGKVADLATGHFPLVERILSDTTIGDVEAAEGLAEIARRVDISLEERYEALAHGLNLDFKSFSNFVSDPDLPSELAQRYLDELLNQNKNPILQIEGCLALLGHSDQNMQSQAAEQLAFLVEKESLVESRDDLRKAAFERVEYLRKNPSTEVPTDSPGDVPKRDSE